MTESEQTLAAIREFIFTWQKHRAEAHAAKGRCPRCAGEFYACECVDKLIPHSGR